MSDAKAGFESHVAAFKAGRMVLIIDDQGPGTGVMACAAEVADASVVNDMAMHARGLVCLAMTREQTKRLGLLVQSHAPNAHGYTVSIEAAAGVTTGISAADRARTVEVAIDPTSGPDDVVSPGHLFPVQAHPAGVLARRGAGEAVVDLAQLAGSPSGAGVYCQVLAENGDEANLQELHALAAKLDFPTVEVGQIIRHRTKHERLVRQSQSGNVPTAYGDFDVSVWEDLLDGTEHVLLALGEAAAAEDGPAPLVRVHSQCLTGDVFGSHRCDCGAQLRIALQRIRDAGQGALLYLRQEGRGIGLVAKLKAYALQDRGRDTVEANEELGYKADLREYGVGAQILDEAGYHRIRLLTNNPRKISGLRALGIDVAEGVALETAPLEENLRYLRAKKDKLGHLLESL